MQGYEGHSELKMTTRHGETILMHYSFSGRVDSCLADLSQGLEKREETTNKS